MPVQDANVAPKKRGRGRPKGSENKPKNNGASYAAVPRKAAEVVAKALTLLEESESRHSAAVIEAIGQQAIRAMLEHRGISLRLRKLLNVNLTAAERIAFEVDEPQALTGLLSDVAPRLRQTIFHALSLPTRIDAVADLVTSFSKLVAIDKELLGFNTIDDPTENAPSAFTPEEEARLARMHAKFKELGAHVEDVTDVEDVRKR